MRWPPMGRPSGRHWGRSMAAYEENTWPPSARLGPALARLRRRDPPRVALLAFVRRHAADHQPAVSHGPFHFLLSEGILRLGDLSLRGPRVGHVVSFGRHPATLPHKFSALSLRT